MGNVLAYAVLVVGPVAGVTAIVKLPWRGRAGLAALVVVAVPVAQTAFAYRSARGLEELAGGLWYVEFFGVTGSIIALLVALRPSSRRRAAAAVGLAAAIGLTVAQPFGVEGTGISADEWRTGNPVREPVGVVHSARVLGVPLFGFRPYTSSILHIFGDLGQPTTELKVLSWLWPGFLSNGGKVEAMCGSGDPCWTPRSQPATSEDQKRERPGRSTDLFAVRAGGEWRYRLTRQTDGQDASAPPGPDPAPTYYRLGVGITSWSGVVYWVLGGGLSWLVLRRRRSPASAEPPAWQRL